MLASIKSVRNQEHDICMLKDLTKQFTKDLANLLHQTKPWDLVYRGEIGEIEKTPDKKRHIPAVFS